MSDNPVTLTEADRDAALETMRIALTLIDNNKA